MKQCLLTISIFFFSVLFILAAYGMSYGAINGMREESGLETAMSVVFFGPLSLLALAAIASSIKTGFDEVNYKSMKPIIIVLAMIQLVLMGTYIVMVWSGK